MNPHPFDLRECDNDDLYEFVSELGLDPAETAQMQEADDLNDEILGSVGGDMWNVRWLQRFNRIDMDA